MTWIRDLTEEGIEPHPGPRSVTENVNSVHSKNKLMRKQWTRTDEELLTDTVTVHGKRWAWLAKSGVFTGRTASGLRGHWDFMQRTQTMPAPQVPTPVETPLTTTTVPAATTSSYPRDAEGLITWPELDTAWTIQNYSSRSQWYT